MQITIYKAVRFHQTYNMLALTDCNNNSQIPHNYHITCTYFHCINKNIFHLSKWAELLYRNKCCTCKCAYNEMRYQITMYSDFSNTNVHNNTESSLYSRQILSAINTQDTFVLGCPLFYFSCWLHKRQMASMSQFCWWKVHPPVVKN